MGRVPAPVEQDTIDAAHGESVRIPEVHPSAALDDEETEIFFRLPEARLTRSKGPAPEYPHVQPRILEYDRSCKGGIGQSGPSVSGVALLSGEE